jgi:hypothetical protein
MGKRIFDLTRRNIRQKGEEKPVKLAIKLVSEAGNELNALISIMISGVTSQQMLSPEFILPDGTKVGLADALLKVMKGHNFHNFYPDLVKDNPEGGVYAGNYIRPYLIPQIKAMRPDLGEVSLQSFSLSFERIDSSGSAE